MEYQRIEEVNKRMKPVDIKGKNYNTVNQRILAFRELYPNGSIQTEILSMEGGAVLMKATAYDDQFRCIATGHAREKEDDGYINKTSFIENCETSAIGRCLGIIGIGAVDALASFEEVANAITQQNKAENDEKMLAELKGLYDQAGGADFERWFQDCTKKGFDGKAYASMKAILLKQINKKLEGEKK